MVQVVENRADIEGVVLTLRADANRADHWVATIEVHAVTDVESYPNLFRDAAGTRLDVIAPPDTAAALGVGKSVRCRIRRAGPATVFAQHCA